jgi:hypothetical protein
VKYSETSNELIDKMVSKFSTGSANLLHNDHIKEQFTYSLTLCFFFIVVMTFTCMFMQQEKTNRYVFSLSKKRSSVTVHIAVVLEVVNLSVATTSPSRSRCHNEHNNNAVQKSTIVQYLYKYWYCKYKVPS